MTLTTNATPTLQQQITGLTGATAAVYTALCSQQAVTATALALAAEVSPSATRKALVTLEQRGLAHRTPGGNDRTRKLPDLWYLTATADEVQHTPHGDTHQLEATADSADAPELTANTPTGPAEQNVDEAHEDALLAGDVEPGQASLVEPDSGVPEASDLAPDLAAAADDVNASEAEEEAPEATLTGDQTAVESSRPEENKPLDAPDPELGEGGRPDDSTPGSGRQPAVQETSGEPGDGPGEHTCVCATCGNHMSAPRRKRPAPVTASGPRLAPGQLHQMVREHLQASPEQDLTPTQISRTLGRSSGAIANALDTMVSRGEAIMTSAKPRRYQAAPVIAEVRLDGA